MKLSPAKSKAIRRAILNRYRKLGRDFPWRSTSDPYEILISEIMLQQTQASRVKEKLPAFIRKFPNWRALSRASTADLLRAWQGMGYNSRAVRLKQLASVIVNEHGGKLPDNIEALRALPGIGPYTASAVMTFAFRKRVPVVDVNIRRVLSRLFALPLRTSDDEKNIWTLAGKLLPHDTYDWTQALMDFGATICTARNPKCAECPLASSCPSKDPLRKFTIRAHRTKKSPEPSHDGLPRRLWRGRVIEALRTNKRGIGLHILGTRIKSDFSNSDSRWLADLTAALERDGLVTRIGKYPKITLRLAE
ncbi:MAG TPA: A/G-specific adenine glycosylase [Bacteroidota bacterium]|nr:A/G-specific adenine glycosylase [Bacteroidota bacterium]